MGVYLDISELPGEGGGIPGYIWATRVYLSYKEMVGVFLDISGLPGEGKGIPGYI